MAKFFRDIKIKAARALLRSAGGVAYVSAPGRIFEPYGDAMCVAAVNRRVRLISESIASMPLNFKNLGDDGVFYPRANAYSPLLLVEPNGWTSAFALKRSLIKHLLLDGVVYLVPRYRAGAPSALLLVTCEKVRAAIVRTSAGEISRRYTITDTDQGINIETFKESEVLVFRMDDIDRSGGISANAQETIELAQAGAREARRRVENGGAPRFLVQDEEGILGVGQAQESRLRTFLSDLDVKLRGDSTTINVPSGLKLTPAGASNVDLQFQTMREFAVREICRFFGVPPTFVYSDGTSNYKTTDAANTDFLSNTLDPILRNIENEFRRKLVARERWNFDRYEFDRSVRIAIDSESRARYYVSLLGVGLTPNEIRAKEGLSPVDGGDTPFVSANLRPVAEAAAQKAPTIDTNKTK